MSHPITKSLINKLFPYYDDLCYMFKKYCGTRAHTKTLSDVGSNVPRGYEGFSTDDRSDMEIPMIYSQG